MNKSRRQTFAWPYFILFPAYFAYHWSAMNSWSPLFIGGYINEMSALVLVGALLYFFKQIIRRVRSSKDFNAIDISFTVFMVWFLFITLVHAGFATALGVTKNHIASIIQLLACFIAFRVYPYYEGLRSRQFLTYFTAIFTIAVLYAAKQDLIGTVMVSSSDTHFATYQGLARAYLFTAVLSVTHLSRLIYRFVAYLLVFFVLFLLGSRSEIVGSMILFLVFEVMYSQRRVFTALVAIAITISAAFVISISIEQLQDLFPENRMLYLILLGESDGSVLERSHQIQWAWKSIADSPLMGDYGIYERQSNSGAYAHNWISAWVDLGILGVLLFWSIFITIVHLIYKMSRQSMIISNNIKQDRWFFAMLVAIFSQTLLFFMFSKGFNDIGLAILAGFASAGIYNIKNAQKQAVTRKK